MELLTELRNHIDLLGAKPGEVDIDETRRILSEAYSVALDGLNRSQDADRYRKLKPKVQEIETQRARLEASLSETATKLSAAEKQLEAFAGVLAEMRKESIGQVTLINRYSEERKEQLKADIESADVSGVLSLRSGIREDFNSEWSSQEPKIKLRKGEEVINIRHFKTGA